MAEENEVKKKKASTKKKSTSTTRKRKTTPKKVEEKVVEEIKEEVKPIEEEVSFVEEKQEETKETTPIENAVHTITNTMQDVSEVVTAPVKEIVDGTIKKKPSAIIILLIILLVLFMILVSVFSYFHPNGEFNRSHFIKVLDTEEMLDDYPLWIESEEEFHSLFPHKIISGAKFKDYKYAIIEINYDPCSESNIKPIGYKIENNILDVKYTYEASCGGCAPKYLYYLLELDPEEEFESITYSYESVNDPGCNPFVAYKPIIYFYPEQETTISVQLGHADDLTTTYPTYQNGWNMIARSDGTLMDPTTGREYYALFWEGKNHPATMHSTGFVVKGEDTQSFLEEKLSMLGLSEREANEFIIYWLPRLENNPYNYLYFESMEEIHSYMPLTVTPNPDTVIRVQMDYKPLEHSISVEEQKLVTPERDGFTVVEWGGSIIKD